MTKSFIYLLAIILLSACGGASKSIIPTSSKLPTTEDNYTIIWSGNGKAYRYLDGDYQRDEAYDYTFEVVQRRYQNTWNSIKNMHRIHPDYDGKAGEREQTMYFEIAYKQLGEGLHSSIKSSLGNGKGKSDEQFRKQSLELDLNISSMAPYNTIRITQDYRYEEGILVETVELYKKKDGQEIPFMKNEEEALIFRPQRLEGAPTKFIKL